MQFITKEQRAVQNADFKRRLQPRPLWNSQAQGTYVRKLHGPLKGHK